jgi:hypothetical protein
VKPIAAPRAGIFVQGAKPKRSCTGVYCKFRRQSPGRKEQARCREGFHHGLLAAAVLLAVLVTPAQKNVEHRSRDSFCRQTRKAEAQKSRYVSNMDIIPQAAVVPKDTSHFEQGKYGPISPKTPACYGFTVIAYVKPGTAQKIRNCGNTVVKALQSNPYLLGSLKLHSLRWVLFDHDTRFMYQAIFDVDDYTEDTVALFRKAGIDTIFVNLEDFPLDWKTNTDAFTKFVRDHQCNGFLDVGEFPYFSSDEIKKAEKTKAALSDALEQLH